MGRREGRRKERGAAVRNVLCLNSQGREFVDIVDIRLRVLTFGRADLFNNERRVKAFWIVEPEPLHD